MSNGEKSDETEQPSRVKRRARLRAPINPIPWAIAIAIILIAWSISKRPLNECEPTSFEIFQYFKLQLGGCTKSQVEPVPSGVTARVFIQIADESQRPKMQGLQEKLRRLGFAAPGIENVKGKAGIPANPNVRYFNDGDKQAAEKVVAELKAAGFPTAYPYRVNMKAPPGSLEIWLSSPA